MSGSSPVLPPGSGVSATVTKGGLLSGAKGVVAVAETPWSRAPLGSGCGSICTRPPKLQVVQRNTSQMFLSGPGKKTLVARCFANETLLGGGYDAPGAIVTRSDKVDGQQAWWVDFATQTGGETMTAYVLCVNAKLNTETNRYTMSQYKPFEPGLPTPSWSPGFTATALGFYLDSHILGRLTPVPMRELLPGDPDMWFYHLAPTTNPDHAPFPQSRIADRPEEKYYAPQMTAPDAAYTFAYFRLFCVQHLTSVSQQDQSISVGAQTQRDAMVPCPKGTFVLGGGYNYTDNNVDGRKNSSYDDGWLYASRNAPATPGTASGTPVTGWYVTAVNQETENAILQASVW